MALKKLESLLGLAEKAGKVKSGEFAVEKALQDGSAELVIISAEASDNTRHKFQSKSSYYGVRSFLYGSKEGLGHAIGKQDRAVVAVTDRNLSAGIEKIFIENAGSREEND